MRKLLVIFLLLFVGEAMGQVKVNGKVQGDFWTTDRAMGEVEIFHIWGRRTVMPVKSAWVNIVDDRIMTGAETDDPFLDGKVRSGYHMAMMQGKVSTEFPEYIQTLTQRSGLCLGINDEANIQEVKTAMLVMKEGEPVSVTFTQMEYASFDVPKFIRYLESQGGEMALRTAEGLQGFNLMGFRQRTFYAVFE